MSCTWSGTITATGTLTPSGTTVSGSHSVSYSFSFILCPSGNLNIPNLTPAESIIGTGRDHYIEADSIPIYYYDASYSGSINTTAYSGSLNHTLNQQIIADYYELTISQYKISVRKESTFSIIEFLLSGLNVNIFRSSSGWMGEHWECWGCPTDAGDVRGGISIYGFDTYNWLPVSLLTWLVSNSSSKTTPLYLIRPAYGTYKIPVYNYSSPYLSYASPPNGAFLVDPFLLPYEEEINLTFYSTSANIKQDTGGLWIDHHKKGSISTQIQDTFGFWSHDFKTQWSGYGWRSMNAENARVFTTNSGFSSCYLLEGSTITLSGIYPCEEAYTRGYTISGAPTKTNISNCDVLGTKYLDITPSSSTDWQVSNRTAPFLYWGIPSGLNYWRIETGLSVHHDYVVGGQRAGLLLAASGNLNSFYFFGSDTDDTASGIALYSVPSSSLPTISGLRTNPDPSSFHLMIEKLNNYYNFKWSQNAVSWTQLFTIPVNTTPISTFYSGLYAYHRLEETSGNFLDASGNNRYGTRTGTITSTSGVYDRAATASGTSNTYINIRNMGNHFTAYTIAFWFKPSYNITSADTSWWTIIGGDSNYHAAQILGDFAICMNRMDVYGYYDYSPGGGYLTFYTPGFGVCSTTRTWNSNTWYHIIAQFHSSANSINPYKLWVNGVQEQSNYKGTDGSVYLFNNQNDNLYYFWNPYQVSTSSGYARCSLDEVAHWNRELSVAEISALYTSLARRDSLNLSENIYVGPAALNKGYPSRIEAHYDYAKFITTTGINIRSFIESGDTWEQIVDKGASITTSESSGAATITYPTYKTAQVSFDPKSEFDQAETIAIRYRLDNYASLKVPYTTDSGTIICIAADLQKGVPVNEGTRNTPIDISSNHYPIYSSITASGSVVTTAYDELKQLWTCSSGTYYIDTNVVYEGSGSVYLTGDNSYISTNLFARTPDCFGTNDWTLHSWWRYDQTNVSGILFSIYDNYSTSNALLQFSLRYSTGTSWTGTKHNLALTSSGTYSFGTISPTISGWHHIAFTRNSDWIYAFCDGVRLSTGYFIGTTPLCTSSNIRLQVGGSTLISYLDLITLTNSSLWKYDFNKPEIRDSVYAFTAYASRDLGVSFNIISDTNAPKLVSVQPASGTLEVCPEDAIVFDILDDYTGVDLNNLVIHIDGDTVWSGGVNQGGVRGVLTYAPRGELDGEWESYGVCNAEISGTNRLLYPPNSVYDNSGAWGYRFTYSFFNGELPFGHQVFITASGLDQYTYPNFFSSSYDYTVKTNTELVIDNFFLSPGQKTYITDNTVLYADLYNTRYPINDVNESGCSLRMYDGNNNITCSGFWFTTYTGIDSIVRHRLHYESPTNYSYSDHRAMHWEFTARSTYSGCDVFRAQEFILYWGMHLYWPHRIDATHWPAFGAYENVVVFVRTRTQTFLPMDYFANCVFTTTPMRHSDLGVSFYAKPVHQDLPVYIFAHNTYLLYDEDVEWTITAADYDGNVFSFTGTFHTEAHP